MSVVVEFLKKYWMPVAVVVLVGAVVAAFIISTKVDEGDGDVGEDPSVQLEQEGGTGEGSSSGAGFDHEDVLVTGGYGDELSAEDQAYLDELLAEGGSESVSGVPAEFVEQGLGLGGAWMTYDTRMSSTEREAQLSEWIPNAEDWSGRPAIASANPDARGNPGFRTVSHIEKAPVLVDDFTLSSGGVHEVCVRVYYGAEFSIGGRGQGTWRDMWADWVFTFNDAGELVDVDEPPLPN